MAQESLQIDASSTRWFYRVQRAIGPWCSLDRFKLSQDYRARLPPALTRYIGYRPPGSAAPYEPIPPLRWLKHVPLQYEEWAFAWIGSCGSILLIEAIMTTNTVFRDVYHAPVILLPFGASAVLVFGVIESPLSQPKNLILGHFIASLIGVAITRLFARNPEYQGYLTNDDFHPSSFFNGGLSMATSLLAMLVTGTTHPPGGATGLNVAVQYEAVAMSWRYIPTIVASSLIMLGWAMIINNIGRRRYPTHWWSPGVTMVRECSDEEGPAAVLDRVEQGEEEVEEKEEALAMGSVCEESGGAEIKREEEVQQRMSHERSIDR